MIRKDGKLSLSECVINTNNIDKFESISTKEINQIKKNSEFSTQNEQIRAKIENFLKDFTRTSLVYCRNERLKEDSKIAQEDKYECNRQFHYHCLDGKNKQNVLFEISENENISIKVPKCPICSYCYSCWRKLNRFITCRKCCAQCCKPNKRKDNCEPTKMVFKEKKEQLCHICEEVLY
jgi:hypothetical protein